MTQKDIYLDDLIKLCEMLHELTPEMRIQVFNVIQGFLLAKA